MIDGPFHIGDLPEGAQFQTILTHRTGIILEAGRRRRAVYEGVHVILDPLRHHRSGEEKTLHPHVLVMALP
jgi:hypothetical protein